MEWHDLRDCIEDSNDVRAGLKLYKRQRWYVSAKEKPEHPYVKFVTDTCDNVILNNEMFCDICGNKHAMYTVKNGWVPLRRKRTDTGAAGRNEIASGTNRFRRNESSLIVEAKTIRGGRVSITKVQLQTVSHESGSDHSSDGTDIEDELYSNEGWEQVGELVLAEQEMAEAISEFRPAPMTTVQRMTVREELKAKYPELYED